MANMSSVLDEMKEEARKETLFQVAEKMVLSGKMTDEEIAAITKLTLEEVKELSKREI